VAWTPDGNEIWFTASKSGVDRTLYAVTLDGKERMVLRLPGALMLFDIFKDGRVLMMRASWRRELIAMTPTMQAARSFVAGLHLSRRTLRDGKMLLFDEEGGGGSLAYSKSGGLSVCGLHSQDRRLARDFLLGAGGAVSLSPDGKSVIAQTQDSPSQLRLLTTGAGDRKI